VREGDTPSDLQVKTAGALKLLVRKSIDCYKYFADGGHFSGKFEEKELNSRRIQVLGDGRLGKSMKHSTVVPATLDDKYFRVEEASLGVLRASNRTSSVRV
jgi:hypothetical protein